MDNNDTAFTNTQSNEDLASAINQPKQDASVFDQIAYEQMTLEQKFAASKEAAFKKFGVTEQTTAPTMADQAANSHNNFTVYQDGSIGNAKGVIGNDRASAEMVKHLRAEAYKKYGIEGSD